MENDYISALERAVESLNSNIIELQLDLDLVYARVMKLKKKVFSDNLEINGSVPQCITTENSPNINKKSG